MKSIIGITRTVQVSSRLCTSMSGFRSSTTNIDSESLFHSLSRFSEFICSNDIRSSTTLSSICCRFNNPSERVHLQFNDCISTLKTKPLLERIRHTHTRVVENFRCLKSLSYSKIDFVSFSHVADMFPFASPSLSSSLPVYSFFPFIESTGLLSPTCSRTTETRPTNVARSKSK